MDVYDAIVNINTVLILLAAGLMTWIVRQIVPDPVENTKIWRIALRLFPIFFGGAVSLIPGLRPMENTAQCVVIGAVSGSLAMSTYEIVREIMGQKIRAIMGSPQARKRSSQPPIKE